MERSWGRTGKEKRGKYEVNVMAFILSLYLGHLSGAPLGMCILLVF